MAYGRKLFHDPRIAVLLCALLLPACAGAAPLPLTPPLPPARPAEPAPLPPLPPPRPPGLAIPIVPPAGAKPEAMTVTGFRAPPAAAFSPGAPPEAGHDEIAEAERVCATLFSSGKVVARASTPLAGPGGCAVPAPIEVSAVILSPTARIALKPAIEINCPMGGAFADWVRDDIAPAFAKIGRPLVTIADSSGYSCRGRNRVAGAKLSEHGKGNAVDVGAFVSADGRTVGIKDKGPDAAILADVKRTACARFTTVLGPGSDGYHETHLHVDLEVRRNGGRFCHWDMP